MYKIQPTLSLKSCSIELSHRYCSNSDTSSNTPLQIQSLYRSLLRVSNFKCLFLCLCLCGLYVFSQQSISLPVYCLQGDGLLPGRRTVLPGHCRQDESSAAVQNSNWFVVHTAYCVWSVCHKFRHVELVAYIWFLRF